MKFEVINELDEYGNPHDPQIEHRVKRECMICFTDQVFPGGWIFNKNTGTMHIQHEEHLERTRCGKEATREEWLWQM